MLVKTKNIKVLLTGGHAATTAIATVQEFLKRNNKADEGRIKWELFWIGSKQAIEGTDIPPLETLVFSKLNISYFSITSGKLQRNISIWTIPSLVKIPIGFFQALNKLRKIRPDIVLSFGGYTSLPVVVAAKLMKIPVVLHEQTVVTGLANKLASPFADMITLARPESSVYFPNKKTRIIGNPIMTQIRTVKPKSVLGNPPTLLILGGSRGSQPINNILSETIEPLLEKFVIIHQTGFLDYQKFFSFRENLPIQLKKRYDVYELINPLLINKAYQVADIIISRAGANTVAEIMTVKRPAILIPLPFAYKNEQKMNAIFAEKFGIAKVLDQESTTPKILFETVLNIKNNWQKYVSAVSRKRSPDENAEVKLVDVIQEIADK